METQVNEINKSLENTHLMLLSPKLFISNYFIDLKAEIDAYFVQYKQNERDQWKNFINKIEAFENDYYKTTLNDTFKEKINLEIDYIKTKLSFGDRNKRSSIEYYETLLAMTDHIQYRVQKVLLSNKSFIFLDTSLSRISSEKISLLLIINDEYVRKSKMIYFDLETNLVRLTNEMTKIIFLFVKLNKHDSLELINFLEINLNISCAKELWFNRLQIKCLEDDAFEGFENLERLYLDHNLIDYLNQISFQNLNQLKKLDLGNNLIESIEQYDFLYLKQLTDLSLSHNKIRTIQADTFKELKSLKELNFNGNLLTEINVFTFADLDKLERLHLKGNQIIKIEENSFEKLKQLKHLNLMFNNLGPYLDINWFSDLANLNELSITSNKISNVGNSGSGELKNLSWISLSGNCITSIDENAFIGLKNLNCLYLDNNSLTILNGFIKPLTNLKHLDLSDNLIVEIEKNVFENLSDLQILKLENNKLTSIEHEMFNNLKNLSFLNLCYNSLKSLHLKEVLNLKNLKLHRNELEHLRLKSLDRLQFLNLSNNPIKDLSNCDVDLEKLEYSQDQINLIDWENSKIKFKKQIITDE